MAKDYSVDDIAEMFSTERRTVLAWVRQDLTSKLQFYRSVEGKGRFRYLLPRKSLMEWYEARKEFSRRPSIRSEILREKFRKNMAQIGKMNKGRKWKKNGGKERHG